MPENWGLEGKVAIVTGGGASGTGIGNGRAAAILLARAGTKVVVVDKALDLADKTVAMIKDVGGEAIAFGADLTRDEDCAAMVQAAVDRFGRLDFLDNNVGIGSRGSVVDETEESWRRLMQVNVDTMFLAAKHAIPAMRRTGGGAIVNVSSISALRPRGLTAYSVSKGAVIALTKAMAVDHGPEGIRVNCVAPGPVYTPMVYQRGMSAAAHGLGAEDRGHGLGHRPRRALSPVGLRALHHRPRAGGGRRRDALGARAGCRGCRGLEKPPAHHPALRLRAQPPVRTKRGNVIHCSTKNRLVKSNGPANGVGVSRSRR